MERLALAVDICTVLEETEEMLKKKRAVLLVGQTDYEYPMAVNMRNGCFNGYAMYAGFKNRHLKNIKKYFERKFPDIHSEFGEGWLKLYIE